MAKPNFRDDKVEYEGYMVDLLDAIFKDLGLNYHLQPVEDGRYGSRQEDETWDGMIGQLIEKVTRSITTRAEYQLLTELRTQRGDNNNESTE